MEPSSPSHKRAVILLFFLFLWAALVAARLFYFTVLARSDYLAVSNRVSTRFGVIPAIRGRILKSDGSPLAWSEFRVDMIVASVPSSRRVREFLEKRVREVVPGFTFDAARENQVVAENLSPEEMRFFLPLVSSYGVLRFSKRSVRRLAPGADSLLVGETVEKNGVLVGVSGWEKKFDGRLRSVPGKFRVMVDRTGRWIPGTWREIVKPCDGRDVVVSWERGGAAR